MSSTKIVIIVLVLVGLLFVIFVARGALRKDPKPDSDPTTAAKEQKPPDWTKTIEGLFSSLKPKRALEKKVYSFNTDKPIEETIKPDDKQPFRTVKFHLLRGSGSARIEYTDVTPIQSKDLKDLQFQKCPLPADFNAKNPQADLSRCSIVALRRGGKVKVICTGNIACRVEVE
jgi:hypothetical protein